jgi:hypothetical protein
MRGTMVGAHGSDALLAPVLVTLVKESDDS